MKQHVTRLHLSPIAWSLIAALGVASIGCQTTYDANGNARQSVDPGLAVAGAAAAGVVGYAIASDNANKKKRKAYNSGYYDGAYDSRYHRRHPYYR